MHKRAILEDMERWALNPNRKPLVLRGARQVGKTTVVSMFSKRFSQFLYLNLELPGESILFDTVKDFENLVEAMFFLKKLDPAKETLIFIDEIQNSPGAVTMLRYFHEKRPDLYVIAAGSLLENLLDLSISFPVGRVEFMVLRPFSFHEFLMAIHEDQAALMVNQIPLPEYVVDTLRILFHRYVQVGGMPEAVSLYSVQGNLRQVERVYDSLLIAYQEDVEKYASKDKLVPIMRHVIQTAFHDAGLRVTLGGFGNSSYRAGDVKDALQLLEKAFLFNLLYPCTMVTTPLLPDSKRAPRLHVLDVGLLVHSTGLQEEIFLNPDISTTFSGRIVEQIVGQELQAHETSPRHRLQFWVRDKSQSNAEVDWIIEYHGWVIPVEVKSGTSGRLRSLHQFMDIAPHATAVRLYDGLVSIEESHTIAGKIFRLINLPFFLASRVEQWLEVYFVKELKSGG